MRIKALDSIRGVLLLQMTLDHFGKPLSQYLYQCFGFFSAAEGFFFLSGFVGALAAISKSAKDPSQSWMRKRALKIWQYHCVSLAFIATLACTVLPRITWQFKSLNEHPVAGTFWSALLINTPDYFDVLPLYIIFLVAASVIFPPMVRSNRNIAIAWSISLFFWLMAPWGPRDFVNSFFPKWIDHGFFNLMGWQFLYMTGAAIAALWKRNSTEGAKGIFSQAFFKKFDRFLPALLVGLIILFLYRHQFIPNGLQNSLWIDKAQVGPLRLLNFMGFVGLISYIVRHYPSLLDFRITNIIGRHSLDVYTAHVMLVCLWFAVPPQIQYHAPWNILAPITACILLWLLALWRDQPHKK